MQRDQACVTDKTRIGVTATKGEVALTQLESTKYFVREFTINIKLSFSSTFVPKLSKPAGFGRTVKSVFTKRCFAVLKKYSLHFALFWCKKSSKFHMYKRNKS